MATVFDKNAFKMNGFLALVIHLLLLLAAIYFLATETSIVLGIVCIFIFSLTAAGYTAVQPNDSRVLIFLGNFVGVIKESGFFWANPFAIKKQVSLRVRNFNSERIKVNDKEGNPIEIAAVISWKVYDSGAAIFDVEKYDTYVSIQSETAIRTIATKYPYDSHHDDFSVIPGKTPQDDKAEPQISLRENSDRIAQEMKEELGDRLKIAGVEVLEARLSHLAYSPEIAQAMLRRQQAQAIIMARKKIVDGAVSMVEMALKYLSENNVVVLDEDKKAQMVNNLLVTLTADREAQPVINTGTIYS